MTLADPPGHLGRTEAVAAGIRLRIAARALPPGARIPSVRAQAEAMGVEIDRGRSL